MGWEVPRLAAAVQPTVANAITPRIKLAPVSVITGEPSTFLTFLFFNPPRPTPR